MTKIQGTREFKPAFAAVVELLPPPRFDGDAPITIIDIRSWVHFVAFTLKKVGLAVEYSLEQIIAAAELTNVVVVNDGTFTLPAHAREPSHVRPR